MTIREFMEVANKDNSITIFAGDYELKEFTPGWYFGDEDDILLGDLKIKKFTPQDNEIIVSVCYNLRVIREGQ